MINDNPITYLVLTVLIACAVVHVLKLYIKDHPSRNEHATVKNFGYNTNWGE